MIFLFIKFKEISLFCDKEVELELDKYLNILEFSSERMEIESLIKVSFLKRCKDNIPKADYVCLRDFIKSLEVKSDEVDTIDKLYVQKIFEPVMSIRLFDRTSCVRILLHAIGFSYSKLFLNTNLSKVMCELAFKMYRQNWFDNLRFFDINFLLHSDEFSAKMVVSIINYRYGKRFDSKRFHRAMYDTKKIIHIFEELRLLYCDKNVDYLFEYLMCYDDLSKYSNLDKEPAIIVACEIFKRNELDFFKITNKNMNNYESTIPTRELYIFAKSIDRINNVYGLKISEVFSDKVPTFSGIINLLYSLAVAGGGDIVAKRDKLDPEQFSEYLLWCAAGFIIEDYIKKGYKTASQLSIIRYILKSNKDPDDFNLSPNMTAEDMKISLELSSVGNKNPVRKERHVNRGNMWYAVKRSSKR